MPAARMRSPQRRGSSTPRWRICSGVLTRTSTPCAASLATTSGGPQPAGEHVRDELVHDADRHLHLPAQQVVHGRRRALVWHVQQIGLRDRPEHLGQQVLRAAGTAGCVLILPGWRRANSTSSWTLVTGTRGWTASASEVVPSSDTGAKARCGSNGIFSINAGFMETMLMPVSSSVWPSAGKAAYIAATASRCLRRDRNGWEPGMEVVLGHADGAANWLRRDDRQVQVRRAAKKAPVFRRR